MKEFSRWLSIFNFLLTHLHLYLYVEITVDVLCLICIAAEVFQILIGVVFSAFSVDYPIEQESHSVIFC